MRCRNSNEVVATHTLMTLVTVGGTWCPLKPPLEPPKLDRLPSKIFAISGGDSGELKVAASGVPSW